MHASVEDSQTAGRDPGDSLCARAGTRCTVTIHVTGGCAMRLAMPRKEKLNEVRLKIGAMPIRVDKIAEFLEISLGDAVEK